MTVSYENNPSFVLVKPLSVEFEDRSSPQIIDQKSVKIQIKKTGICGSDIHFYSHGSLSGMVIKEPLVLGHESSGIVIEIGSEVTQLNVGDKVALEPGIPNRYSAQYKSGRYNLCPDIKSAATPSVDGTLCKYYILPEDFCVKLPEGVSLNEGALVEPLSVAVHAAKLAGVQPGYKIAVYGAGPVGQLITAVAAAFGASNIIVIDLVQSRLDLAKDMGATEVYLSKREDSAIDTANKIISANKGQFPDVVFEASGAESSINSGIHLLKAGGTFVQVGMGAPVSSIPMSVVIEKELIIKGSFRYSFGDYPLAVELISDRKVDVKKLITHVIDFSRSKEAFEITRNGLAIKCIINGPV